MPIDQVQEPPDIQHDEEAEDIPKPSDFRAKPSDPDGAARAGKEANKEDRDGESASPKASGKAVKASDKTETSSEQASAWDNLWLLVNFFGSCFGMQRKDGANGGNLDGNRGVLEGTNGLNGLERECGSHGSGADPDWKGNENTTNTHGNAYQHGKDEQAGKPRREEQENPLGKKPGLSGKEAEEQGVFRKAQGRTEKDGMGSTNRKGSKSHVDDDTNDSDDSGESLHLLSRDSVSYPKSLAKKGF